MAKTFLVEKKIEKTFQQSLEFSDFSPNHLTHRPIIYMLIIKLSI